MKVLEEIKELIPLALKNRTAIVEGVVNKVKEQLNMLPEDEAKEILRRRLICAACPFMSENAKNHPVLKYKSERVDEHCTMCKCNIELKTSSFLSECGIEVHNLKPENTNNQMELRWRAYKTN